MPAHGNGRLPPSAVHVNHPCLGKHAQQLGPEQQRTARTFHPDRAAQAPTQPREEMPEVRFGRLPGLSAHDRLQFVEQRFIGIGEMRKRPAQNGRHVLPGEPGVRVVDRIAQFLVPLAQHEAGAGLLPAVERPHPVAGPVSAPERSQPDEAEELGQAEDARVPIQDVGDHRRAAPSGAQDEDRRDRRRSRSYHRLASSASSRSGIR